MYIRGTLIIFIVFLQELFSSKNRYRATSVERESRILPWLAICLNFPDTIGMFLCSIYNRHTSLCKQSRLRAKSTPDWAACTRTYTRTKEKTSRRERVTRVTRFYVATTRARHTEKNTKVAPLKIVKKFYEMKGETWLLLGHNPNKCGCWEEAATVKSKPLSSWAFCIAQFPFCLSPLFL